jgi:hypothetical protein
VVDAERAAALGIARVGGGDAVKAGQIDAELRNGRWRQLRFHPIAHQQQGGSCVGQHEFQPRSGIPRVKRQVGTARLQHGEQRDDHLGRALNTQPHQAFRADPRADQTMRELIGALVHLGVAQPLLAAFDRQSIRGP